jgi:hypothetical protein
MLNPLGPKKRVAEPQRQSIFLAESFMRFTINLLHFEYIRLIFKKFHLQFSYLLHGWQMIAPANDPSSVGSEHLLQLQSKYQHSESRFRLKTKIKFIIIIVQVFPVRSCYKNYALKINLLIATFAIIALNYNLLTNINKHNIIQQNSDRIFFKNKAFPNIFQRSYIRCFKVVLELT